MTEDTREFVPRLGCEAVTGPLPGWTGRGLGHRRAGRAAPLDLPVMLMKTSEGSCKGGLGLAGTERQGHPRRGGTPVVTAGAAEPGEDADAMTSVSPCLPFRRVHVTSVCLHRLLWSQHMTWGTAGIYWVYIYAPGTNAWRVR